VDLGHPRRTAPAQPAEDGPKRPGKGREGGERSDACDNDRRVADPLPCGGHERREVVRKRDRGSVAGGIVDAEGNDEEVCRLARDSRHQLLHRLPGGRSGKAMNAP
jgi:hypothetical protein